jgi:very-short-patch-repair endonuclease
MLKSNKNILKPFRKQLRNRSTSAEAVLWTELKSRKLDGRKFRRQQSIGNFIVDFYCAEEKLIIELDGESHGDYSKIEEDLKRDNTLIAEGYKVLRFENRVVFQDIEWLKEQIRGRF